MTKVGSGLYRLLAKPSQAFRFSWCRPSENSDLCLALKDFLTLHRRALAGSLAVIVRFDRRQHEREARGH